MFLVRIALSIAILSLPAIGLLAQDQPADHKADNTSINKRDRQKDEPTADNQKDNAADRERAKNIRRAIVQDKSLSTYAHNVKVISEHGTVTLKGPVRSEDEKRAVESKAAEIAGHDNVKSEISVVSKDSDHSR